MRVDDAVGFFVFLVFVGALIYSLWGLLVNGVIWFIDMVMRDRIFQSMVIVGIIYLVFLSRRAK